MSLPPTPSSDDTAGRPEEARREEVRDTRARGGFVAGLRRSTWADLTAVTVVLGVALLGYVFILGGGSGPVPGAGLAPGTASRLMSMTPRSAIPATLDLAGTRSGETAIRPEGAAVGLSFRVHGESRPLVLEERAGRETVVLFPPPGQSSTLIPAWQPIEITDPGGGTFVVRDPPGPRRVRLVVFPPGVDPLAVQPTELARLGPKLTIVERRYVAAFRDAPGE